MEGSLNSGIEVRPWGERWRGMLICGLNRIIVMLVLGTLVELVKQVLRFHVLLRCVRLNNAVRCYRGQMPLYKPVS